MHLHMILTPVKGSVPAYLQKTIYNIQLADHPGWIHSHVPAAFKAPLKHLVRNAPSMTTLHFIPYGETTRYFMQNRRDGVFVYAGDPTPLDECDNYIDYNTTSGADTAQLSASSPSRPAATFDGSVAPYEPPTRRQRLV